MRLRLIVFALLAAASFSAAAGSVDLNLSSHSIEAKFYANAGAADWTFGGLYNRDTRDRALNVGLLATGDSAIGGSRFEGGLGGKVYSVTVGNADVLALALDHPLRLGLVVLGEVADGGQDALVFGERGGLGPEMLTAPAFAADRLSR